MEYFTLNNGIKMPMAGIGVFMMSPAEAESAVESALKSGVRLIDTANGYMNESGTGRGIKKSGVAREDIFLVTKLWPTVYEKETAIEETLNRLDTDYIDLLFLHQPTDNWREGYRNIEKPYKEGKVKLACSCTFKFVVHSCHQIRFPAKACFRGEKTFF